MPEQEPLHRPPVLARNGVVATAHPLATAAGLEVLQAGGNAMDAAIAAALVTGVVLPAMCGLGGDAFALYYHAATGRVTAFYGSGGAPARATREYFVSRGYQKMPFYGPLSISVPGAVSVYFTALERFGSWRPSAVFERAIQYAEEGFPLTPDGSATIAAHATELAKYPTSRAIFLPDGDVPPPGTLFRQPDLARTLRAVAQHGPEVFYRGDIAQEIGQFIEQHGGLLTASDLADYACDVGEPIQTTYRGYTVFETGLPTQGVIVLEALNIIEQADLAALDPLGPDLVHLLVEVKKLAFADRLAYCGDPRFVDVPLATLLDKEYARRRFAQLDRQRAQDDVPPGAIDPRPGETTYLCVVDQWGNAVSFIHSLSAPFGSHVVAGRTGVLLNNRAGRGFTLEAEHPNVIAPGKRTMHTLNCWMVMRDGALRWVGGTPGGDQQPQWNLQALVQLIDYQRPVQEVVEWPRWQSFPGTDPINLPNPFALRIETRYPEETRQALAERGHRLELLGPWGSGGAMQVIARDPVTGVLTAASDPRAEGIALGF
jgi:gamma-glutamyltranspeptidase/glutathione hydrolase